MTPSPPSAKPWERRDGVGNLGGHSNYGLGRPTLKPFKLVTIIPRRAMHAAHAEAAEQGPRAHPRLHWRRSHVRVLHAGLPDEKRIVIPRFLVGLRDADSPQVMRREYKVH